MKCDQNLFWQSKHILTCNCRFHLAIQMLTCHSALGTLLFRPLYLLCMYVATAPYKICPPYLFYSMHCHATPHNTTPYHTMSRYSIPCCNNQNTSVPQSTQLHSTPLQSMQNLVIQLHFTYAIPPPLHTTPRHTIPHRSLHFILPHDISHHTTPLHTTPRHTTPHHSTSYYPMTYHTSPLHLILPHDISHHTTPLHWPLHYSCCCHCQCHCYYISDL